MGADGHAGDLYVTFADKYAVPVFGHIAAAETQHLNTVRTLLARYGLTDPTADKAAGKFSDPAVQADPAAYVEASCMAIFRSLRALLG